MSTETSCEVTLRFTASNNELITVREKELIERIPLLERAVAMEFGDWQSMDVKVEQPIDVPFEYGPARLLFARLREYKMPAEMGQEPNIEDFKEANEMSLEELRDCIELANFMECSGFVECLGFVIAQKLRGLPIEEVAAFLHVDISNPPTDTNMDWVHPPLAAANEDQESS
ncbi:unnamed protein product [Caenorhabditis sp. 36 PRJEB53466]|nr:unnamed protein product [Caenorhabditis sp. 36 PRJEB53466]